MPKGKPHTRQQRQRMAGTGEEAIGFDYNARFDGLESKLNKLLQVNTSTNTLLDSAVKRIEALETRFESAMAEVHDYGVLVETQMSRTGALEKKLQNALDHIDQLENRNRQNNLRLLNVLEGSEKDLPMPAFLVKTFAEKWKLELKEEDFERAHRVGARKDDTGYPRAIIFKLHHYQKRLYIWKGTRRQIEGCNFKVVPDMSAAVREKRKAFWPLREQLHQNDIKTFLKFPATLYVEDGDLVNTFTSPEKARLELKKYTCIK